MYSPKYLPGVVRLLFLACAMTACKVYDESRLELARNTRQDPTLADPRPAATAGKPSQPACAAGASADCDTPTRADSGGREAAIDSADDAGTSPDCTSAACPCSADSPDRDGDGAPDCRDKCPDDPDKLAAGSCGCGVPDADRDGDGTADCKDACPEDADKRAPGSCGCGTPDSDDDHDGTANCLDACPDDPHKTQPGSCGCGASDPSSAAAGRLYCAKSQLLHRYRFDGTSTTAEDSIGDADAVVSGGSNAVQADGALQLVGDAARGYNGGGYAALPSSAFADLTSATFEAWLRWNGSGPTGSETWQRVFDFGTQRNNAGDRYLFLTVAEPNGGFRVAFSLNGSDNEVTVTAPTRTLQNVVTHVAVVVDAAAATLRLVVNGERVDSATLQSKLADIVPANLWLGRSNFANDPEFCGSLLEFRIYGSALSDEQLRASAAVGPDYDFAP